MKKKAAIFAILIASLFAAGLAPVSAGKAKAAPQEEEVQENGKAKAFNDILFKLVRQDEYLDEALEILDTASGHPGPQDLAALRVTLKTVAKNLKHISALNKAEFTRMDSDPELLKYTNTILSYSRKVDRKAARLASAAAQLTASNKKAAMRDAVSSRKKGSRRKTSGKKLTQILEEQKAMDSVSAEIKNLRSASRGLSATSNWLYIASK